MSDEAKRREETDPSKKKKKKEPVSISLPVLPNDEKTADDEMNELFNEDRVTHKHGHTEPERD